MSIHFQLTAIATMGSRKGMGKARAKMPTLVINRRLHMFDHLQIWIFHFMKTHEWFDQYNAILLSVPAYHDLTPKNKSY
jgi:hypothetical protein